MLRVVVVLLLMALAPLTGRAAPVTVEFEGVVTELQDDLSMLGSLQVNDVFSGFYTYDDSAHGGACLTLPNDPGCVGYDFADQPDSGIALSVNGVSVVSLFSYDSPEEPLRIDVRDADWGDAYLVRSLRTSSGASSDFVLRDLVVLSLSGDFLSTNDLVVPELSSASTRFMYRAAGTPSDQRFVFDPVTGMPTIIEFGLRRSEFVGTITYLRVVPEPTALALLVLGLGVLLAGRAVGAGPAELNDVGCCKSGSRRSR